MTKRIWLQLTSGRGPMECCWVVGKLLKEIKKETYKFNITCDIIHVSEADNPDSYKSVLMVVEAEKDVVGSFLEQWLGTILWIGKSPYRAHHKRKNWFVGIESYSEPEHNNYSSAEVTFETMRSSGPGGQNVNKTETAVRAIHVPSGISVLAQEERSQTLNKKLALARLLAILEHKQEEELAKDKKEMWEQHNVLERGNPIRIYQGKEFKLIK